MKKPVLYILILSVLLLQGCGGIENYSADDESAKDVSMAMTENVHETEYTFNQELQPETINAAIPQLLTQPIDNDIRPELEKVTFRTVCSGNIYSKVWCSDLYNINVLHSNVVGLFGSPVEIDFDSEIKKGELTFYYNKNELRGIPEENLIFLHYVEDKQYYEVLMNFRQNTENSSMSIQIREPGVYLLADAYQWFDVWGMDTTGYEYDRNPSEYISDWERECNTGDIMKIADIEWAQSNAPLFNISTPEQLAGVVYYVNTSSDTNDYTICLENDVDLSGYEWAPMGWRKNGFKGSIDGMGHTISNMKISNSGEDHSGFVGYGMTSTEVCSLNIVNAEIYGGRYAGILGGEFYLRECTDVNVSGTITADSEYGAIIGCDGSTYYENCTSDVTINGEKYDYFSPTQKIQAETPVTEAFTLYVDDDLNVIRDEADGYDDLTWYIMKDGKPVLQRNAENELVLESKWTVGRQSGKYTVYLTSFINGAYIRISNIVEFE